MISGIMAAVSGMRVAAQRVNQASHNIANVNTTGFQPRRVDQVDMASGGAAITSTSPSGPGGPIVQTGQPLDMAIDGGGFFTLSDGQGSQVYSRSGIFMLNDQRQVVDHQGRALQPPVTLPAQAESIAVSPQGVLEARGGNGQVLASFQIETASFGNPGGLRPIGGNAYAASAASGPPVSDAPGTAGHGLLVPGALQGSGTDLITETVNLITGQRSFEANVKSVQTQDEMLGAIMDIKS